VNIAHERTVLTLALMSSHCVPLPDAGAPAIMTLRGSANAATTALAARREERVAGERRPAGLSRRERELGAAPGKRTRPWAGVLWFADCAGEREAAAAVQAAAMEEAIGGGAGGRRSYLTFSHYVSYSGPNSSHPNPGLQLLKLDSPKGFDEEVS